LRDDVIKAALLLLGRGQAPLDDLLLLFGFLLLVTHPRQVLIVKHKQVVLLVAFLNFLPN